MTRAHRAGALRGVHQTSTCHPEAGLSIIGLLGFLTVVVGALVLMHGLIWARLVRATALPGRMRRRLTLLVVGLALLPAAAVALRRNLPPDVAAPLEWVAFIWLALAFYLFVILVALEPVRLLAQWWLRRRDRHLGPRAEELVPQGARSSADGRPDAGSPVLRAPGAAHAPPQVPDPSRRVFLARGLAATAGAVAVGTVGTGAYFANAAPLVERVPIALRGLDPALDGFRIVTFADAHLSATFGRRRFERLVEIVNAQQPDVVAIVGDLVDGEVAEMRQEIAPLGDLVTEQGVYFVTGNHEYFVDTRAWLRHLPTLGVEVLRNERVSLTRGGAAFDLAGIDDRTAASSGVPGHAADLDAALDGRNDTTPVVLLAHQPVMIDRAVAAGVDLQLSGHTHGGQLWPFDYAIRLDQPVVEGLSRHGDTQLYVTRGAGYWGPPVRVGARPEVTVVELRSAP